MCVRTTTPPVAGKGDARAYSTAAGKFPIPGRTLAGSFPTQTYARGHRCPTRTAGHGGAHRTDALPRPIPSSPATSSELATYTHAQLVRFDNRFRRRLLHAFQRGLEHKESAAADVFTTIDTPASALMARRRTVEFEDRARSENPDLSGRTNAIW